MDLKGYMYKTGVTKKSYVDEWIDLHLIPGAERDEGKTVYQFVDSSLRPYRTNALKPGLSADKLRAHIVKAAIARHYISAEMCFMSRGEFDAMVSEMVEAGILQLRTEDDIVYIDSTSKSDAYMNKSVKEIRKFILECLEVVTKAATEGTVTAVLKNASSSSAA